MINNISPLSRPNLRKMIKADTLASVGSFNYSQEDNNGGEETLYSNKDLEMTNLTHRIVNKRD